MKQQTNKTNNSYGLRIIPTLLILISGVIFLSSCGGGSDNKLPSPGTTPTVTAITPIRNASSVPLDVPITVSFSQAMNIANIEGWMTLSQGTNSVTGTISTSSDSKTGTFSPTTNLQPGKTYTVTLVTLNGFIKDKQTKTPLGGNHTSGNYIWNFITATNNQTGNGPTISSKSPQPGEPSVALNSNIKLVFSSTMDEASIRRSFKISSAATGIISGKYYFIKPKQVDFIPVPKLIANETYTVLVDGITDINNVSIQDINSWTFKTILTTGAPDFTSRFPKPKATNIPVNTNIVISFTQAMNQASIESSLNLSSKLVPAITGVKTYTGNTVTFNPSADLTAGENYTISVNGIVDSNNNSLKNVSPWTFTTAANPINTIGPKIVSRFPLLNDTLDINQLKKVTVMFDSLMNLLSIQNSMIISTSGGAVKGNIILNGKTAEFTPTSPLIAGLYNISLVGITDISGSALQDNTAWSFTLTTTKGTKPAIKSVLPTDGSIISLNLPPEIIVIFSQPMDFSNIKTTTWLTMTDPLGLALQVSGTVSAIGNTFIFTIDPKTLTSGITYTVSLNTANIKSAKGLPLLLNSITSWSLITK